MCLLHGKEKTCWLCEDVSKPGEMQYCDGKPGEAEKKEPPGILFDDSLSKALKWLSGK